MNALDQVAGLMRPRWDGSRVLFEIADSDERIRCAISRAALQHLSQRRHCKAAEALPCFVNARTQIEAIALGKLRAITGARSGTLGIWTDDIADVAPGVASAPAAADPHGGRSPTDERISTKKK
jgi:Protein of unknown function (DUF1488)